MSKRAQLSFSSPKRLPSVNTVKAWLHQGQAVLTLLTVAVVAPIIAIERRFYQSSQAAPNYTLFVAIFTFWIPLLLVIFPWMYEAKDKFKRIGKFCMKPRTNLIFTGFCSFMWATAGIAITVHSQDRSQCDPDVSLVQQLGSSYTGPWHAQCQCAKAAAGFVWTTCIFWTASLICSFILYWKERQLIRQNLLQHEQNRQEAMMNMESADPLNDNSQQALYSDSQSSHKYEEPMPEIYNHSYPFHSATNVMPATMTMPHPPSR